MTGSAGDHHATWEEHYTAKPQVWSGRVNARLAEVVPQIAGTRALDLGCGEGADAIWLAEHGWTVTAVDISDTALARARAAAVDRGLADRIDFQQHELTSSFPDGPFDLVSAQFLHSTLEMDRSAILRRAAASLAPGGTLLIVDHAAAPPWASKLHHHEFPSAESVVAGLALDSGQWERIRVESADRVARGPDGEEAVLVDNVILLRRSPGSGK
ncbi:MAG: class I SAM-dependent methyltransferase [Actinomycetota bacterium]|jgi:SAM-dependent methyltransferase|nr:class I SAM-dependent methyltransferase [Actinomycetota bacterium]